MSSPKLIVILGATGNQGGSVANAFLKDASWQVRALSRNTSSPKAQALAARGAQVVQADLDEPETFSAAFEGANAIFAVSDFWGIYGNPANADKANPGHCKGAYAGALRSLLAHKRDEVVQGKVYSCLPLRLQGNGSGLRQGEVPGPVEEDEYLPTRHVLGQLRRQPHHETSQERGRNSPVPLKYKTKRKNPVHRRRRGYREYLTVQELASAFTRATGLKAEAVILPKGEFPVPLPDELKGGLEDNFAAFNEFGNESWDDTDIIHPRDLKSPPSLGTVEDFFRKQDLSTIFGA
ncbi:uncharacterized protein PAC_18768 [Phialocephala subalpina]|uniref:NmrA-like domain-containing protein n=1 Tax=Phialocephala subalpina TaxID=576137 RepID=A0A1L7XV38_9HELO|nr:uncharacterized protein PAC_18768 [Phialocephala subalpina]